MSVGAEWTYRSYIEGGKLAAAVWTSDGIDQADYPDGLPLEMIVRPVVPAIVPPNDEIGALCRVVESLHEVRELIPT